jgi:hypothetical protein
MNRRRVFALAAALLAAIVPLAAQQATTPAPSQKLSVQAQQFRLGNPLIYEFQHLDDDSAMAVVRLAQTMFGVHFTFEPRLHAVVLSSVIGGDAEKAVDFLKHYDVPPPPAPQIHFVAYLIRAADAPPPNAKIDSPIPQQLEDVVAEMKKSFVYTHYTLLDTVTSVSQGGASASDMLPGLAATQLGYEINYADVSVSPDRKAVNVRPFRFQLHSMAAKDTAVSSISSNITVHDGQKLVLGKVRLPEVTVDSGIIRRNPDLFVVLTVKVE